MIDSDLMTVSGLIKQKRYKQIGSGVFNILFRYTINIHKNILIY